MELIKIKKGNQTLEVTPKVFEVIYKDQGFKLVTSSKKTEEKK